jgi:streptogramin lyase
MRFLRVLCGLLAAVAFASSASAKPVHSGHPVGLIREIPIHGNAGDIAAGPEGNLWFTQNLPVRTPAIGRITPKGKVTRFRKGLSGAAQPLDITAGPDGNIWFTYDPGIRSTTGGGVGRITPAGQITLFPEPAGQHGSPFEIVVGPDGNLWFTHSAILSPTGQTIGRITPNGDITEFSTGLRESADIANLTPGPGGVWFADESSTPAIGRITPDGEITEFPGLQPHPFPIVYGPTQGPEGNLWFTDNEQKPATVERITPDGTIERFGTGINPRAEYTGPFAVGSDGNVWFRVERRGLAGSQNPEISSTAIGRITPGGQIDEFDDCLRPMPEFAGPNYLTLGPDRNIWFTTWPSGEPAHVTRASTPSIGRITPSGEITEFRLGLHPRSSPDELVSTGGRLWFIDRETEAIGTIVPPRKTPNTFLVLGAEPLPGAIGGRLRLAVPGPGDLTVSGAGLRPLKTHAPKCRPRATIALIPNTRLRRDLASGQSRRLSIRITYKPDGGKPFTQRATVKLRGR